MRMGGRLPLADYLAAWLDDPRDMAPASAWLLKGDEASYPTLEELEINREEAANGVLTWDCQLSRCHTRSHRMTSPEVV